jgi:phosphoribosylglycinamide formyltransferase-1
VLISGRGSNLQALIDASRAGVVPADIVVVVSNKAGVPGLERARRAGIEALVIPSRGRTRDDYDAALLTELRARDVSFVCLAGFMRVIGRTMLDAYPLAIVNVHPSLLPAFPGLEPQKQAVEYGVKVSGVTVHFVTSELDAGPIVVQRIVPVRDDDTVDSLAARILEEEHRAYPEAVSLILEGDWRIDGRRVVRSSSVA